MAEPAGKLREDVLRRVLRVARHLGASAELDEILSVIIDAMRDTLDAERATVFEYDAKAEELFSTVAHGIAAGGEDAPEQIRIPATAGLAGQCAQERAIINVPDAYADDRFNPAIDRETGFRTRSILTIPLVTHDEVLVGVAQVLNKRHGSFGPDDEEVARALAAHAAVAIQRGRLIEDRLVRLKLERDLEVAERIQQATFPGRLPTLRGFDLGAWSRPAEQTGGDAYDVIAVQTTDDVADRALLLMADATGHGVGPALSVTQLRSMFRMAARLDAPLAVAARHLNQQLCEDLPSGRFITAWLGLVDGPTGVITGFSAGQAPILLYREAGDEFDEIEADMPPFGVIGEVHIEVPPSIRMAPGDVLAVLSDGIFEAMNDQHALFGLDAVMEVIRSVHHASADEILTALRDAVDVFADGHPADDDRTGIVIKAIT